MMKKVMGFALVLCMALALAACGGVDTPVNESPSVFAPGTTINGVDVSEQTPEQAADTLRAAAEHYSFTLKLGEHSYTAAGGELKLAFNEQADIAALLGEQEADASKLELTVAELFSADVTALVSQVEATYAPVETEIVAEVPEVDETPAEGEEPAAEENTTVILVDPYAAKNAWLKYDETAMQYVIVADEDGLKVDYDVVAEQCLAAVTSLQTELEMDLTQFTVKAALTADSQEMKDALAKANACLDLQLTYTFTPSGHGTSSYTLSREELASVYYLADDMTMQVDEEILGSLVSMLDGKYSVAGEKTKFKTTGGSTINISVATAGQSVDNEGLYNDMLECLTKQIGGTRVAPYVQKTDSGNGYWGGNYVEVDLTSQHLWLYKSGKCILSCDIVSGCVEDGTTTPTGCFTIFAKNRDRYLRGNNVDGTRYESWVSYFMPFSGGCGLHDATWRVKFGGTEYWFNGSHGCVGMTLANAEKLYNNVNVGTHVVVYGGLRNASQLPSKVPVITTDKELYTIEVGQTLELGITHNSDAKQWLNVSSAGIVTVLSDTAIRGERVGTVGVGIYLPTTGTYRSTHKDVTVIVVPKGSLGVQQDVQVSMGTNLLSVAGEGTQITVTGNQTTPVFSTSDPSVVMVNSSGKVTPVGSGTANIIVTCPATEGYKAFTTTLTVTVTAAGQVPVDQAISASAVSEILSSGGSTQITVTGAGNRELTYIPGSSLITVSSTGEVKVVGDPTEDTTVTVRVIAAGNSDYNRAEDTVVLIIKPVGTSGGGEGGAGSSTPESGSTSGGSTSVPGSSSGSSESGSTGSESTGGSSASGSGSTSGAAQSGGESSAVNAGE